jgi:hypothetical protein
MRVLHRLFADRDDALTDRALTLLREPVVTDAPAANARWVVERYCTWAAARSRAVLWARVVQPGSSVGAA